MIRGFSKTTLYLYKTEGMLHLTANRGFLMLNHSLPILASVIFLAAQFARTTVDTVINIGKVFVVLDFRAFFDSNEAAITINHTIILAYQFRCN